VSLKGSGKANIEMRKFYKELYKKVYDIDETELNPFIQHLQPLKPDQKEEAI